MKFKCLLLVILTVEFATGVAEEEEEEEEEDDDNPPPPPSPEE
jgi:hypothetical protein